GGNLDPVPERGLHHVDPELEDDVLLVARELLVCLHPQNHVEVAGRTAPQTCLPFAADPDLRAAVDSGRALAGEPPWLLHPALPATFGARVPQDQIGRASCRQGW